MRKLRSVWIVLVALTVLLGASHRKGRLDYPKTRKGDVVEDYHGVSVADPYRWLEDDVRTSDEVASWVQAENEVTFGYLESIPQRKAIKRRLTELWNYERITTPFKRGGRYYYYRNDGLQNQSVLYKLSSLEAEPEVLLDPNQWSEDGTQALAGVSFSDDGKYMAFAKAVAGSDWQEWFVYDLATDRKLDDHLQWTKYTSVAWTKDGKGFFYSVFDAPPPGQEFQALNKFQKLYYHRVSTPQSADVLVYHRPDQPEWGFTPSTTEDGRYLVIQVWKGTDAKYRILYKDLLEPYGMPVDLIDHFENIYAFLGNDGPIFYFRTDLDAPRGRVIAIDIRNPEPEHYREIIPQSENALRRVGLVGNLFVARYLKAFDTRVLAADRNPDGSSPEPEVSLVPLDELLREADIVTLHVNLCEETLGFFGQRQFAVMKKGAWLVNTSRGEVLNESALLQALRSGHLAGAALDVLSGENVSGVAEHPLVGYAREHGNLIITPHIGGCTTESMEKTEQFLSEKLYVDYLSFESS